MILSGGQLYNMGDIDTVWWAVIQSGDIDTDWGIFLHIVGQ